jgi:membrane-associated phospholipid phosphatase
MTALERVSITRIVGRLMHPVRHVQRVFTSTSTKRAMRLRYSICVLVACAGLQGCATLPNGHLWGADATLRPGWSRVREAAVEAARDPWVWAPAAGAALFQIDDWDRRTSDWARTNTPVFGSQRGAEDWSDDLRTASAIADYITIVATPGGDDASDWMLAKGKGTLTQLAAVAVTGGMTKALKSAADRERPTGSDDESFPSGHTSNSAVHTRLASENLRSMELSSGVRRSLDFGLDALTIATGWARVEAGAHFPSDTLVGMALGNFVGSFVNRAFLGLDDSSAAVSLASTGQGMVVRWQCRF